MDDHFLPLWSSLYGEIEKSLDYKESGNFFIDSVDIFIPGKF